MIKTFYNNNKNIINPIAFIVMGFIILYVIIYFSVGNPLYLKSDKELLKIYQKNIDSVSNLNKELSKQVLYFQSKDSFYISQIEKNKGKTEVINRYYYEKISRVDDYDVYALQSFFTERYRDSTK